MQYRVARKATTRVVYVEIATIEAESSEQAIQIAKDNYSDIEWREIETRHFSLNATYESREF